MARATVGGVELEYEVRGDAAAPTLLLIMGLGAQLISWDDGFCDELVRRGLHVVRFDNRDAGLSTWLDEAGVPDLAALVGVADPAEGQPARAPYTLSDMAADAVGLLDHLAVDRAHVCGASMGGMIAQTMAIEHPERVLTLTSIMSSTGAPEVLLPTPEVLELMLVPAPTERDAAIEHHVRVSRATASPAHFDEQRARDHAAAAYDRAFNPEGTTRHLAAILASGSRREALRSVRAPTLVIHGVLDPFQPVEGGRDTARCVPGATLIELDMGHELPEALWPRLCGAIADHVHQVHATR